MSCFSKFMSMLASLCTLCIANDLNPLLERLYIFMPLMFSLTVYHKKLIHGNFKEVTFSWKVTLGVVTGEQSTRAYLALQLAPNQ